MAPEMATFMHLMNNQMQQFMQGMQQQFAALQPVPVHQNGAFSHRLYERCFRRLDKFSSQTAKWKDWRTHFLTSVRESCPPFAKLMEAHMMHLLAGMSQMLQRSRCCMILVVTRGSLCGQFGGCPLPVL